MKKESVLFVFLFILLPFRFFGMANDSAFVNVEVEKIKQSIRSNNDSAKVMLESFYTKSKETKNVYGLTQYHFLKGYLLNKEGKYLSAIDEYNLFIKLQNDSTSKGSIDQLNRIAGCYKDLTEFEKSYKYYNFASKIGEKSNYNKGIGDSFSGIGQILERNGKYEEGMNYYLNSNFQFKLAQDSTGMATSFNNIGNMMYYQGEFEQALEYYKKSAQIDFLKKNELNLAMAYGNIGMIYQQLESLDSALYYNQQCMMYLESIGNPFYLGTIYNNIALVYYDLEDFETSLKYHLKSKQIKERIDDKSGLATSLINIGNLKVKLEDYSDAIKDYQLGMTICDELNTPMLKMNAYKGLSKAFQKTNDYKNALDYYIIYSEINDSLNAVESKNNVALLETKFETNQKEEIIAQQKIDYKNEMAIEEAKSESKTILLVAISLLLCIVTVFFIVFYKKLKLTRQQKAIIEEKNNENKLLLGEIHHRVKNNLQVICSLLSLQEKSITDESAKKAILEGKERVKSMGLIHKMLYQNDNFSGIEMNDYVVKLIDGLMDSFGVDHSSMEIDTNFEQVKLDVDSAIPIGLIINELVINAFKYAYNNIDTPKITIKIDKQTEGLVLQIKDNGNGIPEQVKKSNSFGFKLINSLVRQLNGELTLIAQNGLSYSILIKDYKLI